MLPSRDNPRFAKIVIPKAKIPDIRDALRMTGITDVNMFLEMLYLSQDILRTWRLLGTAVRNRQ